MANELRGSKVAILIAPVGTEQVEFTEPKKAVEDAGAAVEVVGLQTGDAQTMNSDVNPGETFTVEKSVSEVSAEDYDRSSCREAPWRLTTCAAATRPWALCEGSSKRPSLSELSVTVPGRW
jgi:hypothetical protein